MSVVEHDSLQGEKMLEIAYGLARAMDASGGFLPLAREGNMLHGILSLAALAGVTEADMARLFNEPKLSVRKWLQSSSSVPRKLDKVERVLDALRKELFARCLKARQEREARS